MKHPATKDLFEYWNTRRGRRAAPDRDDIEPAAIRRVLADTFILSYDERGGHPFRIAGTRVCAIFGRELKNESYVGLWTAECRQLVRDLLTVVASESVGVIASARATGTDKVARELEVLLLPLSHRGRTDMRVLGALAPAGSAGALWVGVSTVSGLTLGTLRYLGQGVGRSAPRGMPIQPAGRVRHGFVVYDGGQA
jgi:hypothetical protein